MYQSIVIERRFAGPPEMGNGGYVSGLLAKNIFGVTEIILRRPVPLAKPLDIEYLSATQLVLMNGEDLIAEACAASLELAVPTAPDFQNAISISESYPGFTNHPFPDCFVCGPRRTAKDGLRLSPGFTVQNGVTLVATPWIPDLSLFNQHGIIQPEFMWSALDCPGAFAAGVATRPMVLGKITVQIDTLLTTGERCVVIGWVIASEGRKHTVGTAIYSEVSGLCAKAKAVWIELNKK
jgi:hypothetical protein